MKNTSLFLIVLLATPVLATNETAVSTPTSTNSPSSRSYEVVEAKVLKAYVVNEDGAEFRAYVVMWKGHEVVVSDTLAGSDHREGDAIKFLAMRHHFPNDARPYDVLNFQMMPDPHANRIITFADSVNQTKPKAPSYIDCHPDGFIFYPGGLKVSWDELQQADNPVSKLLDKVQEHKESEYVVVLVRPQSEKFYRTLRNLVGKYSIDASYEVVDADTKVDADDPGKSIAAVAQVRGPSSVGSSQSPNSGPLVRAVPTNLRPVFFECRGNKVFFIDKDGLDVQAVKLLSAVVRNPNRDDPNWFLKALQGKEIGNENYKVDLSYFRVGIMALEPRADASGENREQLEKPDGKFQTMLSQLDPHGQYIAFLVRDDSFDVFRKARSIADQRGFNSGWELLGADEQIKFGTGGASAAH